MPQQRWVHGRPRGGGTGICPLLEIGTKKQKFLENVKSGIEFWLFGLILAMTVCLPTWHSHGTRVSFTVLITCSYKLAVHSCPLLAYRGRLWNSGANCSIVGLCCITITWQQIFEDALQVTVVGVSPHVTTEQCCQLDGFPAQLGWLFRCVAGFFLLLRFCGLVLWKCMRFYGLFFRKIFLSKSIVFVNFAKVVRFVFSSSNVIAGVFRSFLFSWCKIQ